MFINTKAQVRIFVLKESITPFGISRVTSNNVEKIGVVCYLPPLNADKNVECAAE